MLQISMKLNTALLTLGMMYLTQVSKTESINEMDNICIVYMQCHCKSLASFPGPPTNLLVRGLGMRLANHSLTNSQKTGRQMLRIGKIEAPCMSIAVWNMSVCLHVYTVG